MAPRFLDLSEVLEIHKDQVENYGGEEGIRDMGLIESALAVPCAGGGGEYFHGDLYEMAAAYLYHLASNHPFIDGNKRVAAMAAFTFLQLNNIDLHAPQTSFEKLVRETARGDTGKPKIAEFFRRHSREK
ncbi:MAG: type II toxin-antitoxin system death-on-curing family toxin [bacterium]